MKPSLVLQFTDTHLFKNSNQTLCGLNTTNSLRAVLTQARREFPKPDALFLTGDLSQDKTSQSYRRLSTIFKKWNTPVYVLPGNHDDPRRMADIFSKGRVRYQKDVELGSWRFLLLDSTIRGENGGRLNQKELKFLETALTRKSDLPTVVSMHHSPLRLSSRWMDKMQIQNPKQFYGVLKTKKQVRAVLFGHVHQEFKAQKNGLLHLATPSTCLQFKPRKSKMGLDSVHPGYRWLKLFPNGKIQTGVRRVKNYQLKPDFTAKKY